MDEQLTLRGAVGIPALQALLTGLLLGIPIGWYWTAEIGFLVGSIIAALSWLRLLATWTTIAKSLGGVEEPAKQPVQNPVELPLQRVVIMDQDQQGGTFVDYVEDERLGEFARRVLDGVPLTFANWGGHGRLFTRGQFEGIRAELYARNMLQDKRPGSPHMGSRLTAGGRALLRHWDASYPPTKNGRST